MEAYSVVITSCGRFDLLSRTLESLLPKLTGPLEKIIIVEDSGNEAIHDALTQFKQEFIVLVNHKKLGQMGSIDRGYQQVTTPYIFHCEDDWEFVREHFIEESAALLDHFQEISMVGLRPREDLNSLTAHVPSTVYKNINFFFYDSSAHPEYFSYSFNPGLRRLADYKLIGPYRRLGYEPDVSFAFKKAGFRIAGLEPPAVIHIGWERHVDDPYQPQRKKSVLAKIKNSSLKRIKRLRRRVTWPFATIKY